MQDKGRNILSNERFQLTLDRLCHQIIENYDDLSELCLVGIQERGVLFANRIYQRLQEISGFDELIYGKLDITFFRDDFRMRTEPIAAKSTEMDFLVEQKKVLLIDDVLYTGRTIQAAMSALQQFGRPDFIELMVLVDRRFNRHLPIKADYIGITVDALNESYVKVEWGSRDGKDRILFYSAERN